MRALQRAVALAQMHDAALAVAEDLDLDVPRPLEIAFEIDLAPSEERRCFVLRDRQHARELGSVAGDLHAAAAAAGRGLDQDRIADRFGCGRGRGEIAHRTPGARYRRNAEPGCCRFRRDFVAHQPDVLGRRADKGEPVLFDGGGEIRVLGEKSEPRVDGVGAGDRRCREDSGDVEVAVARRRRPDADGLVGKAHVHRAWHLRSSGRRRS